MLRVVLTILLPLLLPTLVWLLWIVTTERAGPSGERWRAAPWPWLAGGGVVLAAVVLYLASIHFGEAGGRYVPSQYIDGELVPGRFER